MSDLGNKKIFSKNLQYYMTLNNIDRNTICDKLGFKYSTFSDWYNGNVYPRIDKIEILANFFGILKSDLMEEKKDNTDDAWFRVMKNAKDSGHSPEDIQMALDFVARARKRDNEH